MVAETVSAFAQTAQKKGLMTRENLSGFFLLSVMAGVYVGFGIMLIFSVGAPLDSAGTGALKALMGVSFGVALTLVIFAGSELFTGNTMVMTIGLLAGSVKWKDLFAVWSVSYIGNLSGSLLLAYMISLSGLSGSDPVAAFFLKVSAAKMTADPGALFWRGVLCNILVCLAVWCSARTKDDVAKLGLIFWCLFAFIGSGYEHSVANMTLLGVGLFIPRGFPGVSWTGYVYNLFWVTFGNIIGGAVCVGWAYWFIVRKQIKTVAVGDDRKTISK